MPDVLAYLHSKGLALKNATDQNVHTACVFCGEDPAARGRLYISVDPDFDPPGLYKCFLCGASGNLTTLKRHFGDQATRTELDSATRSEIFSMAAAFYHDNLERYASVAAYLKGPERGLDPETIVGHQIGYAPLDITYHLNTREYTVARPNHLYSHLRDHGRFHHRDILATNLCQEHDGRFIDSLAGMVTIPYHVAGQVVTIRGRTWPYDDSDFVTWEHGPYQPIKAKYKTLGGDRGRLFNTDAAWGTTEISVCEGEFDAMVLEQHGHAAVGVPGASAWQNDWDGYFANMRRVWVIYDRDPAGETGATKLLERVGAKARRVFLSPEGIKCDPTVWFQSHTAAEFAELLAEAGRSGLLVTVHDAVAEFRSVQSQPGLRFGWEEFDGFLAPGLQPAQLLMVLARTNAGKTLFLLNMMHRIRMTPGQEDKRMLFLSLEQTRGEWWDRARRLHRFYFPEQTEADAIIWWQNNIRLVDRNQLSVTDINQVIEDYILDVGGPPDLICLDYLGYLARGFRGEAYERTGSAMHALKRLAKDYRIPWMVPQQVNRGAKDGEEFSSDAGKDSGAVEETADFLLGMWRPDDGIGRGPAESDGVVEFKILKSRHGGRGASMRLQWSPVTLVLVPYTDPNVGRARRECAWNREHRTEPWEETVLRHHPGSLI